MLRQISMKQFLEWQAFQDLEPFDMTRADTRAALIARTFAEVHRNPERRAEPFTLGDFTLRFGDHEEPKKSADGPPRQTWQMMKWLAMEHAILANAEEETRARRPR